MRSKGERKWKKAGERKAFYLRETPFFLKIGWMVERWNFEEGIYRRGEKDRKEEEKEKDRREVTRNVV